MNIFSWKCLAVAVLALVASGCGGGGPKLYKAGGTLTNNNVPVEGAQVTFAYEDGNFANGFTDAAGKFQLSYMNRPGGVVPGKCKVSVSKRAGAAGATATTDFSKTPKSAEEQQAMQAEQQKMMEAFANKQAELDVAGGGSADISKSGLELEVTTDESKNNFVIDLKDFKS
ncbi:MAG: carboxypeptidase-like regulatory domain-containing protein [Pirellulaceae bacterium]